MSAPLHPAVALADGIALEILVEHGRPPLDIEKQAHDRCLQAAEALLAACQTSDPAEVESHLADAELYERAARNLFEAAPRNPL